jgi:HPt (histidine-containing phosphotransfer) domain-containing protein
MAEVFDLAHFQTMTGGDRALQAEIVGLFREQAAKSIADLEGGPNAQGWGLAAHTLKGSARGLGLWALAEACEAAEQTPGAAALERVRTTLAEGLAALEARAA